MTAVNSEWIFPEEMATVERCHPWFTDRCIGILNGVDLAREGSVTGAWGLLSCRLWFDLEAEEAVGAIRDRGAELPDAVGTERVGGDWPPPA